MAPSPSAAARPSSSSPPSPPRASRKGRTGSRSPSTTAKKPPPSARFPGGYFSREGRPSEKEILTARMTDRPLRPLFPKGYLYDTQIIAIAAQRRWRERSRHALHQWRQRRADGLRYPVCRPRGRRARRPGASGSSSRIPTHAQRVNSDLDMVYVGNENEVDHDRRRAPTSCPRRTSSRRWSLRRATPAPSSWRRRNSPPRWASPSASLDPMLVERRAARSRLRRRRRPHRGRPLHAEQSGPHQGRGRAQGGSRNRHQGEAPGSDAISRSPRLSITCRRRPSASPSWTSRSAATAAR